MTATEAKAGCGVARASGFPAVRVVRPLEFLRGHADPIHNVAVFRRAVRAERAVVIDQGRAAFPAMRRYRLGIRRLPLARPRATALAWRSSTGVEARTIGTTSQSNSPFTPGIRGSGSRVYRMGCAVSMRCSPGNASVPYVQRQSGWLLPSIRMAEAGSRHRGLPAVA